METKRETILRLKNKVCIVCGEQPTEYEFKYYRNTDFLFSFLCCSSCEDRVKKEFSEKEGKMSWIQMVYELQYGEDEEDDFDDRFELSL